MNQPTRYRILKWVTVVFVGFPSVILPFFTIGKLVKCCGVQNEALQDCLLVAGGFLEYYVLGKIVGYLLELLGLLPKGAYSSYPNRIYWKEDRNN
jgi:hypothetical protein